MLSGGIDSGLVVALMSQLSGRPVQTFSVGFEEQDFNELPFARLVAKRYGTDHHEFIVRPNALDVLPTLVRHYGEPFADSSAVPSYYLAKMIRQHVKVALNGDGGDECFAGYDRYRVSALAGRYRRLPRWLRRCVLEPLASLIPDALPHRNRLRRAKRFLQEAGLPAPQYYLGWVRYLAPAHKRQLYTPAFHESLTRDERPEWLLRQFAAVGGSGLGALDTLLAVDIESYLPYDLLVKMDIATMANSLEARSPFLDHKVLEFAAALPEHCKLWGRTPKRLLRKLAARYLPAATWDRPKMGFGVPVGRWMRGELRPLLEQVLLSPRALGRGYFQGPALRRIVQEHMEGAEDHKRRLWALLWLELWHREFIDG
jgi:asparagine synthase (glutamine-hydrolysing)